MECLNLQNPSKGLSDRSQRRGPNPLIILRPARAGFLSRSIIRIGTITGGSSKVFDNQPKVEVDDHDFALSEPSRKKR